MADSLGDNLVPFLALCGFFGLIFGSFLNVVIYRLPKMMHRAWLGDAVDLLDDADVRGEVGLHTPPPALAEALGAVRTQLATLPAFGLILPRSACPKCGHPISARENIPILSWLVLRGRCLACKAPISVRYPIVEATTALLFMAAGYKFGLSSSFFVAAVIICYLTALTLIDADTMLLPDSLTLSLLWLALLAAVAGIGLVPLPAAVVGAVAGYLTFWLIGTGFRVLRGIDGMGAGDYKLLAALGACFGWTALLPIVLIAAAVGSVVGISLMVAGRADHLTKLPFGVYLAPAGVVTLFYGAALTKAILGSVLY